MILVITTEAKDEEQIDDRLNTVRNSIMMGDLDDLELMDGSYQIGNHTNIEVFDQQLELQIANNQITKAQGKT